VLACTVYSASGMLGLIVDERKDRKSSLLSKSRVPWFPRKISSTAGFKRHGFVAGAKTFQLGSALIAQVRKKDKVNPNISFCLECRSTEIARSHGVMRSHLNFLGHFGSLPQTMF
jgi:hypothetical protein